LTTHLVRGACATLGGLALLGSAVAHADPSAETTAWSNAAPISPISVAGYGSGIAAGGTDGNLAASTGYITPWLENANQSPPTACLNVQGASSADGTPVITYACQGTANESWILANTSQGNAPPGHTNAIVGLGGKCLTTSGSGVVLKTCTSGNTNQEWIWNATTRMLSGTTGCLATVSNPYTAPSNLSTLTIGSCNNTANANYQWMVHPASEIHLIQPQTNTPYCLDIPNFSSVSGTGVDLFGCDGGANQKWELDGWGDIVGEWGQCLTATGVNGAAQVQKCASTANQAWTYNPKTGVITSTFDGKALGNSNFTGGTVVTGGGVDTSWDLMNRMPVPMIQQVEDNWCWLTVAQMTMDFLGNDSSPVPTQCQEANFRLHGSLTGGTYQGVFYDCCNPADEGIAPYCDRGGQLGSPLVDWGYTYNTVTWLDANGNPTGQAKPSFSQLSSEIAAGRPVPYEEGPINSYQQHDNLLVGVDTDEPSGEQWVIVIDPEGEEVSIPYSVWSNTNSSLYNNWTVSDALMDVHFVGSPTGKEPYLSVPCTYCSN
jgi:Ricin-type beta-trefoil lectin domain